MSQLTELLENKVVIPKDEYKELHYLYLTVKGYLERKNDIYLDAMKESVKKYDELTLKNQE